MDGRQGIHKLHPLLQLRSGERDRPADYYELFLESSTLLSTPPHLEHTEGPDFAEGAKYELCLGNVRWCRSDRDNRADWPDARVLGPAGMRKVLVNA